MVLQSAADAIDNAESYTVCDPGMCLKYVRTYLEIPSRETNAIGAYETAKHKHPGDRHPPDGAPVFWRSAASGSGAGHIALVRREDMRTTDKPTGKVGNDPGSWPREQWGQTYLGWTEDLNGVVIPYIAVHRWTAGEVHVTKLHQGQKQSDSVGRLRYRLRTHDQIPADLKPDHGWDYGGNTLEAVRYWQRNINGAGAQDDPAPGPTDGTSLSNAQANRLFGGNYHVVEK